MRKATGAQKEQERQARLLADALGLPFGDDEVAWDRPEWEACERGTPGCSVRHHSDSPCQTW